MEAEEKLKESERLYRMLADNAQDLICMCDPQCVRRYVSPSYKTVLGMNRRSCWAKAFQPTAAEEAGAREEEFARMSEGWSPAPCAGASSTRTDAHMTTRSTTRTGLGGWW